MSSIIKSQKIRNESIIDFSSRLAIESDLIDPDFEEGDSIIEQFDQVESDRESVSEAEVIAHQEERLRTKEEIGEYRQKQLREIQELIDLKLKEADEKIDRQYAELVLKTKSEEENINNIKTGILFEAELEKQKILTEALEEAENIKEEAIQQKKELLASTEDEVIKTVEYMVESIISDELKYDTRWLKILVKKMIYKDNLEGEINVRISPKLYERLSNEYVSQIKDLRDGIEVIQDESVSETACIVTCEQGTINYDVSEGLQRVLQDIRILLESSR